MKVREFLKEFEKLVPSDLALSFDNVGLLIGDEFDDITGIYICLDINDDIIEHVRKHNINVIISHHPIIFKEIKQILKSNSTAMKLSKCILYGINVISYHTNLDAITNGLNDEFISILGFKYKNIDILEKSKINDSFGIGRIIELEVPLSVNYIINVIKNRFNIDTLRFVDCGFNKEINKLCVINGSGNGMVQSCFDKNIDLIITGDITYHTAFEAIENKVSLIDMGHFNSENIVYKKVMENFINRIGKLNFNIYYDLLLTDVYKYL